MKRASGVLLHISSLYSRHGIGTLGLPAYDFAAFLHKSGQTYWQVLPLGPTGWGNDKMHPAQDTKPYREARCGRWRSVQNSRPEWP